MAFRLAKEAQEVADGLIREHHARLHGVTVTAVFLDKIPMSKGRQMWARAKKIGGLPAFLVAVEAMQGGPALQEAARYSDEPHDFFVIEVAEEVWQKLTDAARKALIDEQLCACEIEEDEETGSVKLAVVGPDVSGWREVVRRHGLWREDLEEFVRTGAEQLSLDAMNETGFVLEEGGGEGYEEGYIAQGYEPSSEVMREARKLRDMGAEMTVVPGGRSS